MSKSIWIKVTNAVTGVVQYFDIAETPTFRAWPGAVFSLVDVDGLPLDVEGLTITQRRDELVLKLEDEEIANILNFYDTDSKSSFQAVSDGEGVKADSSDAGVVAERELRIETIATDSPVEAAGDDEGMSTAMKIGIGLGAGAGLAFGLAGGGDESEATSIEPSAPLGANPDPEPIEPEPAGPEPVEPEPVEPEPAEPEPAARTADATIVGGPLVSGHGLSVEFFDGEGTLLGTSEVDANGQASFEVGDYTGVIIARSVDADDGVDYLDEATGEAVDLTSVLYAMSVATESDETVLMNVTPVSSVAYAKAVEIAGGDPLNGGGSLSAETVDVANTAVASAFGLSDLHDVEIVTVNGETSYESADGISAGERYGEVLATLSGMDANGGGDSQATIDTLAAGLVIAADGQSAGFESAVASAINEGSATADAETGLQTVGSIVESEPADVESETAEGPLVRIDEIGMADAIDASYSGGVVVVSGTASGGEGQTIVLQVGSSASYSSKVETDGSWSVTVPVAGLDGEVAFTATVSDENGNEADAVRMVNVALTSAEITIDPIGVFDQTYNAQVLDVAEVAEGVTITGSAPDSEGSTVDLIVDGETIGSASVGRDGLWAATNVTVGTEERLIEVLAQLTDAAGNKAEASSGVRVNVDTVEISFDSVGEFDQLVGEYVIDTIALTEGVTFSGQASGAEGQTLTVFVNGEVAGTAEVAQDGSWSVQNADMGLVSGALSVTAAVTDAAGFESLAETSVYLDLNPLVIDTLGVDGHIDARNHLDGTTISGFALGSEGQVVRLFVDGVAAGMADVDKDGRWSIEGVDLGSENRSLTLTASFTDSNGMTFNAASFVNVDVPRVSVYVSTIGSDDTLGSINEASEVTISGLSSDAEGLTVNVIVGDVTLGTAVVGDDGRWSVDNVDLSDSAGTRTVTAEVVDVLGNVWSGTRTVKVDLILQVQIDPVNEDNLIDAVDLLEGVTVSGRAAGGEGQTLELTSGDTVLGTTVVTGDGSWSIDKIVFEGVASATHELTASVTDQNGGRSDAELDVYVDTRLLTIQPIGLSNNNSGREVDSADASGVTMSGLVVGAEGQTLELFVNGELVGITQVGNDNQWTIRGVDLGAEPGEKQVTVNVTDNTRTELSANTLVTVQESASPLTVYVYGDGDRFGEIDTVQETLDATISGSGPAGKELEVFVDGESLGTVLTDVHNGSWSIEGVDLGPQDGERTIRVEVDDDLGNRWSSSRVIELDIDQLTVEINPVSEDNRIDAGEARGGVTVSGRAEGAEGQTLELAFGNSISSTVVSDDGSWSVGGVVLEGLPEGDWGTELVASVTDASGGRSDAEVEVHVDTRVITIEQIGLLNGDGELEVDTSDTGSVTMGGLVVGAEGKTLELFVDGKLEGTTKAGADSWTLSGVNLGTDPGERLVSVKVTDTSGTALSTDASVNVVDGAAPVSVSVYAAGGALEEINTVQDAAKATIAGSGLAGLQVEVFVANELEGSVVADSQSGNWSIDNVDLGSEDGERTIRIVVTDELGNRWTSTQDVELDIDLLTIEMDPVSEDNAVDAAEAHEGVSFSGRAVGAEGEFLELAVGSSILDTVQVQNDGSWTVDDVVLEGLPVSESGIEVVASVTDANGGRSDAAVEISVDTQQLTINTIGLSDNNRWEVDTIDTNSVTISGLVVGADNRTLQLSLDGQVVGSTVVKPGSRWSIDGIDLGAEPGERVVTVSVTDNSGEKLSTDATVNVIEQASPISFAIYGSSDRYGDIDSIEEAVNATISGEGLAGLALEVFVDDILMGSTVGNSQTGSWSLKGVDLGQEDGDRTVRIEVADEQGNRWSSTRTVELDIDNATPTGSIDIGIDPTDAELVIDTIGENGRVDARDVINGATISGLAFGSEGQTVRLFIDGVPAGTSVVNSVARWSVDGVDLGSKDSSLDLTASVTNRDAETFSESVSLNIEVPPVSIFINSIGDDGSLDSINAASEAAISGLSSEAEGLTLVIYVDGQPLAMTTVEADGSWSVENVDLSDTAGNRTVTARVTDVLGNEWSDARDVDVALVMQVRIDAVSDDNQIDGLEMREGVTVNGRAAGAEGQDLTLMLGDVLLGTATVDSDGYWSVDGVVLEGYDGSSHNLTASVTSASGDSADARIAVQVDSRLITIDPIGLSNNKGGREIDSDNASAVTLGGLVVGAEGQTLQLFVNGGQPVNILIGDDSRWTKTGVDLGNDPGEKQVIVSVTDKFGNDLSAYAGVSVIDDASPLTIYVYGDGDPLDEIDSAEEAQNASISGSGLAGQELEVFVDGLSVGKVVADGQNGSWLIEGVDLGPHDGERIVQAVVLDELGNSWTSTQTIELDIDALMIVIDPISGDNRVATGETVIISGQAIGAEGETLVLTIGDQTLQANVIGDGSWSVDVNNLSDIVGDDGKIMASVVEKVSGSRSDAEVRVFIELAGSGPPPLLQDDNGVMSFVFDDELSVDANGVLDFLSSDKEQAVADLPVVTTSSVVDRSFPVEPLDSDAIAALIDTEAATALAFDEASADFELFAFDELSADIALVLPDYH